MSLGFAISLPDGVLLMADGRQTFPQASISRCFDDIDKIQPVGSSAFAIPFGISQATDLALKILREKWMPDEESDAVAKNVNSCLACSWGWLLENLSTDVDVNHSAMKAGLIVAGFTEDRKFVVGGLQGTGVNQPPLSLGGAAYQFILLGGEDFHSHDLFKAELGKRLASATYRYDVGPLNEAVEAVIASGESVIRCLEKLDSSIGGEIMFAVIRSGHLPSKERLQR